MGRQPEFLPDGSGVYLDGIYTFEDLLEIMTDDRIKVQRETRDEVVSEQAPSDRSD